MSSFCFDLIVAKPQDSHRLVVPQGVRDAEYMKTCTIESLSVHTAHALTICETDLIMPLSPRKLDSRLSSLNSLQRFSACEV